MGRLGCNDGGKIYVVPINYVYDGKFIIAHSVAGIKIQMKWKNPDVFFEVDEMKSFTNLEKRNCMGPIPGIVR